MSAFEELGLPKAIILAISELGFSQLTPIQEKCYKPILSGKDIMAIAQTGTGKTYAYLLPILKAWKYNDTIYPRVLIIVPTRELSVQVAEACQKLCAHMNIRIRAIHGGINIKTDRETLLQGADIIIGTPGRLMDLGLEKTLRFDQLQKLVIDEFDEILNQGFRFQLTSILHMLKPKRQNLLFSATMTDEVNEVIDDYFTISSEISLAPSGTPLENIEQRVFSVPTFLTKINTIEYFLKDASFERVLLFTNSKASADYLFERLDKIFSGQFGVLHSNKSQNYRLATVQLFQEGKIRGIVTTDIMARGLDIRNISHVINVEFPEVPEKYIHRIGRTGRADAKGIAISLVSAKEEERLLQAEILMNKELSEFDLPEEIEYVLHLLDFERDQNKQRNVSGQTKHKGGNAFHEKALRNKKVNLGGPHKRKAMLEKRKGKR